ncbi:MAG: capsid protein [Circoviridae sp.]|nr:MAG: capsid protein [Circoviridae sp.]
MPYTRRRPRANRRRRPFRRPPGLATRPRMVPRNLAMKRYQGVDTKVFYFKRNATGFSDADGKYYAGFSANDINVGSTPPLWPQFDLLKQIYDQYKVLAIKIRFFPANVGIEPDSALFTSNALLRGQTVVWNDQRTDSGTPVPNSISDVINNSSCKMITCRRYFTRSIYRAKGYPGWANIQTQASDDPWNGSINVLTQDATPDPGGGTPPITLWYFTVQYKVIFRGRRADT